MSGPVDVAEISCLVWMGHDLQAGRGAMNLTDGYASLHPDTVIEETAPGEFTMTNHRVTPASPGRTPTAFFGADSMIHAGDGSGRSVEVSVLLYRLLAVPRGQAVSVWGTDSTTNP